jgi:hypothetical protein
MFVIGQGIFGKIDFIDGTSPKNKRVYLIVYVDSEKIGTLNVSSVAGKEHKLLFPFNTEIIKHFPPFLKKSFVKLDSFIYTPIEKAKEFKVIAGGKTLDDGELSRIISIISK